MNNCRECGVDHDPSDHSDEGQVDAYLTNADLKRIAADKSISLEARAEALHTLKVRAGMVRS